MHSFRVAIVGSGIGGLAVACALQDHVERCVIFEKDLSFADRHQGFGLTLQDRRTLNLLGLVDRVEEINTPSDSHYLFGSDGRILAYYGRRFDGEEQQRKRSKKRFNIRIPRETLRRMLFEKLTDTSEVRFGCEVGAYQEDDTGVFVNGERFDVLVGADGIFSTVRKQKYGQQQDELNYLGVLIVLGISPYRHALVDRRGFYTVDADTGSRLFTMPFSETETMWQLSFRMEEGAAREMSSDHDRLLAHVLARVSAWHSPVSDLISATQVSAIWSTPLYDRKKALSQLRADKGSLVTLVGDSAHPMSPFKGQGANQALLDAERLARCLAKSKLSVALRNYEREMAQNSEKKVLASREAARFLHSAEVLSGHETGVLTSEQLRDIHREGLSANDDELDDKIATLIM